jgi:hypothetical protein
MKNDSFLILNEIEMFKTPNFTGKVPFLCHNIFFWLLFFIIVRGAAAPTNIRVYAGISG